METVLFYIFAVLTVAGGVAMVSLRNPLSGAFALVMSMVGLAALYAMLHAEFVFILQVLVYAGAIMVLVIFTIMLLNLNREELHEVPVSRIRLLVMGAVCAGLAWAAVRVLDQVPQAKVEMVADFGSIEAVGRLMLTDFLYPFEVISLVLLVAIAGVVLLAKRRI
ncbi:MAG: NADH-quinone oxidoreductase subunit J [Candidatus Krumholzibacteria bacterium]|nr:NADH-quinone oxidoreductase subunit J [Candidatus Krumholzibacteria bacterium]